ncbi:MAG: ABC transporter substrate-binding protein [Limnochordia bacterium]|jgi:sn-glycerol 3-phosphate transport system substrate-binding protein
MRSLRLLSLVVALTVLVAASTHAAPVQVDFWIGLSGSLGEVLMDMVNEFNASQDEVFVNASFQGSYFDVQQKAMISIAGGMPPDMIQVEQAQVRNLAAMGVVPPLSDLNIDTSEFIPTLIADCYYKGELYGVPFNRSTPLLYYNKEMFREAGLGEDPPKTWEEVLEFAKKLTKPASGDQDATWGFQIVPNFWFFEAMVWQFGGEMADDSTGQLLYDGPQAVEALKFWQDLIHVHQVARCPAGEEAAAHAITRADFYAGRVAMIFDSTGQLTAHDNNTPFEMGVGFLPAAVTHAVPTGGGNIVILARNPETRRAAAKFIEWFTNAENAAVWSMRTGYMPVNQVAMNSEEMQKFYETNPNAKVAGDQLVYARTVPAISVIPEVVESVESALQAVLLGGEDPAAALANSVRESQPAANKFFRNR